MTPQREIATPEAIKYLSRRSFLVDGSRGRSICSDFIAQSALTSAEVASSRRLRLRSSSRRGRIHSPVSLTHRKPYSKLRWVGATLTRAPLCKPTMEGAASNACPGSTCPL